MAKMKMNDPRYAVGYCRYSSDNQREESITAQQREIQKFADERAITILCWYIDRAITGTIADREEWQKLKKDSEQRNFGLALVHKDNRFSRQSLGEQEQEENDLLRNGVKLVSVTERYENNASGRFAKSVNRLVNVLYVDNLGEEVIKGMKENIYNGKSNGGHAPYGYKLEPIRDILGNYVLTQKGKVQKEITIDIQQAEAVKIMYDMALKGHPRYEIIDKLDSLSYKKNSGEQFTGTAIDHILRNPKYAGIYKMKYNKKQLDFDPDIHFVQNDNGYPAIIDKETYYAVQKLFEKRKYRTSKTAKVDYLLSGKIFCGECGKQYVGQQHPKKDKIYYYYKCGNQAPYRNARKRDVYCHNNTVRQIDTEKYVLWQLKKALFNETVIDDMLYEHDKFSQEQSINQSMIEMLEKRIEEIDREIDNVKWHIKQKRTSITLMDMLTELEDEKRTTKNKLVNEKSVSGYLSATHNEIMKAYKHARNIFENGTFEEKQLLVNNFINKVLVFQDRIEIYINLVPNSLLGVMDLEIRKQEFITNLLTNFNNKNNESHNEQEKSPEQSGLLPFCANDNFHIHETTWLPR